MRVWLVMLSVFTLIAVMCADISGISAAPQNDGTGLIERMTRDRSPASTTPSTLHLERIFEEVTPVKRLPLSKMHVEVGSKQTSQMGINNSQPARQPVAQPTVEPMEIVAPVQAAPPIAMTPPGPARPSSEVGPITTTFPKKAPSRTARVKPTPSFSAVPEIQFDPLHEEHTIRLPDTTNDGFVGVPRSQQDAVGQYTPRSGQYYHQPTNNTSRQAQQRVLPKFFRRGR